MAISSSTLSVASPFPNNSQFTFLASVPLALITASATSLIAITQSGVAHGRPRRPPSSQFVTSFSSSRFDIPGTQTYKTSHPTTIFSICHLSFSILSASSIPLIEEDVIQILQVYSKEINKRMLDTVKSRNVVTSAAQNGATESEIVNSAVESTAAAANEDAKAEEY
ncbi:WPP domain-containing protein 2-like [Pyrus communis]|uniref:WPP domain-containing protein 2-like n=1 Tax=Pyrus communis TaxID=23211 RepID=UPI0035C26AED